MVRLHDHGHKRSALTLPMDGVNQDSDRLGHVLNSLWLETFRWAHFKGSSHETRSAPNQSNIRDTERFERGTHDGMPRFFPYLA